LRDFVKGSAQKDKDMKAGRDEDKDQEEKENTAAK